MTATKPDRNFTIQDPRSFDGDPYQVAERAIQQLNAVVALALDLYEPSMLMVRNADLERTLANGEKLTSVATDWPESPQGSQLARAKSDLEATHKRLRALERAAAYNPRARSSSSA